ncbi:MAG: hypothetical protein ACYTGY_15705 [Planctomycetota bacterium]|jgi:hypothetical protein
MTTILAHRLLAVLAACLLLTACQSRGPGRLPPDRFNYNAAIAQSANEQMLLNLVRLRYSEIPVFLDVSSVLTQYVYMGVVGVAGSSGESWGDPLWSVGGSANVRYAERPTITYTPLKGGEFAEQLLEPIPTDMVFSLVESGWPPEELMVMCFFRVNNLVNVPFDAELQEGDAERLRAFRTAMEQLIELARLNAIEMESREQEGEEIRRWRVASRRAKRYGSWSSTRRPTHGSRLASMRSSLISAWTPPSQNSRSPESPCAVNLTRSLCGCVRCWNSWDFSRTASRFHPSTLRMSGCNRLPSPPTAGLGR